MKILLAEDTVDLSKAICAVLAHQGYDVDPAYDGEKASNLIMENGYDCIVLDIMMPKKDGLAVLKELRESNITTPVLMLTAKAEVDDRVLGLDAGADDYLTKPFAMKELLARLRALTRRGSDYSSDDLSFNDIELCAQTFELKSVNSVRLSLKEYELMRTFIVNRGRPVSCDYILKNVWTADDDATAATVSLYVSYLKRKLLAISSSVVIDGDINTGFTLS